LSLHSYYFLLLLLLSPNISFSTELFNTDIFWCCNNSVCAENYTTSCAIKKENYMRWKGLRKGGGPKLLQAISMLMFTNSDSRKP